MKNILNKKIKSLAIYTAIFTVGLFSFALFQFHLVDVSASVGPIKVFIDEIKFGTVFPEEVLGKDFTVNLESGWDKEVQYKITTRSKPLHEGHEGEEDPDNPGYYRDLCGYLSDLENEDENDTADDARISPDDTVDTWNFDLSVPCIEGSEGMDWEGKPVVEGGFTYGCDFVIETEEEYIPPSPPTPTYGGGGGYVHPTYRAEVVYNYPSEKTVDVLVQESVIIKNTGTAALTYGKVKITFLEEYLTIDGNTSGIIIWDDFAISAGGEWQIDFDVLPIKNGEGIITKVEYESYEGVEISTEGTENIGIVSGAEYVPGNGIVAGVEKIKAEVGADVLVCIIIAMALTVLLYFRKQNYLKK